MGDPAHKTVNPILYRIEEALACWRRITAPVLWVEADDSDVWKWLGKKETMRAEIDRRIRCIPNVQTATIFDAGCSSGPEVVRDCEAERRCSSSLSLEAWGGLRVASNCGMGIFVVTQPDTSYSLVCTVNGNTTGTPVVSSVVSKGTTFATVNVANLSTTTAVNDGVLNCLLER